MSDDEMSTAPPGEETKSRSWFGSLDGKMADSPGGTGTPSSPIASNIHTSSDYMELDQPLVQDDKRAMLEEFERKRRARMIHVSTDDVEVKLNLRQLGEPICLFAEGPADRRSRLKGVLSRLGEDALKKGPEISGTTKDEVHPEETWYHQGPEALRDARLSIARYSISKAKARLKRETLEKQIPEATRTARKQEVQSKLRAYGLLGSQNADTRPISYCSFSPDGKVLATSSWSGLCKLWNIPDCTELRTLRGHSCYVDCIEWHPSAAISMESSALNLASSARDGTVQLWNLEGEEPMAELPQLEARVSRVAFHPSGRFLAACVHDSSWRLWDLQVQEEVLFQEGHSGPVYCLGFQGDGSLAATGGMDSFGRVWDLRTGRCIMFMSEHRNPILSLDWSPDGYHLVTGSEDNNAQIWDVRARKRLYTIAAHKGIVTGAMYDPNHNNYLVTTSFDGSVRLWCNGSFHPLKSLEGHGQKVMAVDVALGTGIIATCSFDRTFKLWGPD